MKKTFITLAVLLLWQLPIAYAQTNTTTVLLTYDKREITGDNKIILNKKIDEIKPENITAVTIFIQQDTNLHNIYYQQIYQARVNKVVEFLISKGVPKEIAEGKNNTKQALPVSILVMENKPSAKIKVELEYTTARAYNDLSTITQHFRYHTARQINITAKGGTEITIRPLSFVTQQGILVNDFIDIDVVEIYTRADMAMYNITTSANHQLLESGGMVMIEARWKGNKLVIRDGENYDLKMPTTNVKNGMTLFYGKKGAGEIDWKNTGIAAITSNQNGHDELIYNNGDTVVRQFSVVNQKLDGVYEKNEGDDNYDGENDSSYLFTASKLGWINCDHFYNTPNKINLIVKTDDDKASVVMIYKNINSVMSADGGNKNYNFTDVPVGEKVVIVAISKKDKTVVFGNVETVIGAQPSYSITMTGSGEDELKSFLKTFN